jgi:hypothetical protein
MAGTKEELIIRIVPELDKGAVKAVQDELDAIKPNVGMGATGGGKASGSKQVVSGLKEQQAEMKKVFDGIQQRLIQEDILLRTTRLRIEREIEGERQKAAQGKITNQQMLQNIEAFEAESVQAANNARIAYQSLNEEIGLNVAQYKDVDGAINQSNRVQSKLLVNTGHLDSGFVTMATSLGKITSQTKNTNLAFMNFGRIIQDAPYGLIGIANNIDPMVVTFHNLANEIDINTGKMRGFGGALAQMGKSLLGPAGIIFLLGSALPSALLVLQSMQRKTAKEAEVLGDAFKKVADEFARLSATAAGERGLPQVTKELGVVNQNIELINAEFAKTEEQIQSLVLSQTEFAVSTGQVAKTEGQIREAFRQQNKELLSKLDNTKKTLDSQKEQLETEKDSIEATQSISDILKQRNMAQALFTKEEIEKSKELYKLRAENLEILDPLAAEIAKEQERIQEAMIKTFVNARLMATESGKKQYDDLRDRLANVADEIRAKHKETEKDIKDSDERIFKSRDELQSAYTKYVQNETINRLNAEEETMRKLMESEFTTDEERLRIFRTFQENRTKILEDELNRQRAIQARADKEALDSINKQRMEFVRSQMEMLSANESKIMDRQDLLLRYFEDNNNKILAIEMRRDMELTDLRKNANAKGLLDTEEYKKAEKGINERTDKEITQAKIEQGVLIADASIAVFSAIFGEGKATATAQVIVDTFAGAQKAIAAYGIPLGPIVAAGIVAKGVTAIRKINSTDRKSKSLSSDTSSPFVREVKFQGVGPNTGQRLSTNADQSAAAASPNQMLNRQNINVQANVDRRGLAIAVREGEQEIRTEQFTYT